jgi:hypothetical protein
MTAAFNLSQLANNLNSSGQLDATDGLTGIIPVANGGTGQSTITANNVILGNGTSPIQLVAPGTSGNALISNGTTWSSGAISKLSTASGSAPSYSARAWATANTTTGATLRASGNIQAVTDVGGAKYQFSFLTPMPDENYAVVMGHGNTAGTVANDLNIVNSPPPSANSFQLYSTYFTNNTVYQARYGWMMIAVFR